MQGTRGRQYTSPVSLQPRTIYCAPARLDSRKPIRSAALPVSHGLENLGHLERTSHHVSNGCNVFSNDQDSDRALPGFGICACFSIPAAYRPEIFHRGVFRKGNYRMEATACGRSAAVSRRRFTNARCGAWHIRLEASTGRLGEKCRHKLQHGGYGDRRAASAPIRMAISSARQTGDWGQTS